MTNPNQSEVGRLGLSVKALPRADSSELHDHE